MFITSPFPKSQFPECQCLKIWEWKFWEFTHNGTDSVPICYVPKKTKKKKKQTKKNKKKQNKVAVTTYLESYVSGLSKGSVTHEISYTLHRYVRNQKLTKSEIKASRNQKSIF